MAEFQAFRFKEGDEVKQGQIVARIVDDSHFKINAKVYPDEFAHIKLNQELALRFSIFDGIYYGKITDINPNPMPDGDEDNLLKVLSTGLPLKAKIQAW